MERLNCKDLFLTLFSLLVLTGSFWSCSENEIDYLSKEEINTNMPDYSIINFDIAGADKETKITTPFGAGRYVTVYAYFHGDPVNKKPVMTRYYKSSSTSRLIPISSTMKLFSGQYDFYAVSTNSLSNLTPDFTNGFSATLKNGVDYLWAKMENISVKADPVTVPFSFTHECAQIIIDVDETFFTFVHSVDGCTLSVPATTGHMNLETGDISMAQTLLKTPAPMHINNEICSLIILPYDGKFPMTLSFRLWINLHWEDKTFETEIPVNKTSIEGGRKYIYKVVVDDNILDLKVIEE